MARIRECPATMSGLCLDLELGFSGCVEGSDCRYDKDDIEPESPDEGEIAEWKLERKFNQPCSECGQLGACAYDVEGRPMIHVEERAREL